MGTRWGGDESAVMSASATRVEKSVVQAGVGMVLEESRARACLVVVKLADGGPAHASNKIQVLIHTWHTYMQREELSTPTGMLTRVHIAGWGCPAACRWRRCAGEDA